MWRWKQGGNYQGCPAEGKLGQLHDEDSGEESDQLQIAHQWRCVTVEDYLTDPEGPVKVITLEDLSPNITIDAILHLVEEKLGKLAKKKHFALMMLDQEGRRRILVLSAVVHLNSSFFFLSLLSLSLSLSNFLSFFLSLSLSLSFFLSLSLSHFFQTTVCLLVSQC